MTIEQSIEANETDQIGRGETIGNVRGVHRGREEWFALSRRGEE